MIGQNRLQLPRFQNQLAVLRVKKRETKEGGSFPGESSFKLKEQFPPRLQSSEFKHVFGYNETTNITLASSTATG